MGKSKRLVRIQAGRMGRIILYTQATASDEPQVRAQKAKVSSPARMRINARTCREACEETMAANFDRHDLFVTFTYRTALPRGRPLSGASIPFSVCSVRPVPPGASGFYISKTPSTCGTTAAKDAGIIMW